MLMVWTDIAGIVFSCTAANHLGLVSAIERIGRIRLPVVNCCKCFTFWSVAAYMMLAGYGVITSLAISFLCAYMATWVELIMGIVDYHYNRIYGKIYSGADDALTSADFDETDTEGPVSEL